MQFACTMIMQERCHKHDPLLYFQPSMPRRSPDWRPLPGGCTWMRGAIYRRMRTTWPQLQRVISAPFAALPGWRVDRCKWDLLHVCFLGFGKDVIGSTLLILSIRAANSRVLEALDRALRGLWVEFKAWCKVRRLSTTVTGD